MKVFRRIKNIPTVIAIIIRNIPLMIKMLKYSLPGGTKSNNYVSKKENMIFKDIQSLQEIVNVVNDSDKAIKNKKRTINDSAIPEVVSGAVGAGLGGVGSFFALYGLGTTGLSGAGIISGFATAGGIIGGGAVIGFYVLAAPIAILAAGGVGIVSYIRRKQLKNEKYRLYNAVIAKQNSIIKSQNRETNASKERIDYLAGLNTLLLQAIIDMKHDLGYST